MKRYAKKIDHFFWFLVSILPLFIYCVISLGNEVITDFSTFITPWTFPFISNIFNSIFIENITFSPILVSYISYVVSVNIMHVFFDFVVFIPRLAHKFTSRLYNEE